MTVSTRRPYRGDEDWMRVRRSYMESNIEFYRRLGFEPLPHGYCPWIKYLSRPSPDRC